MVDVRRFSIFSKILPFAVIASLLSLPLTSLVKNPFAPSFENTLFEVSFMANDEGPTEEHFLRPELKIPFSVDLVPADELLLNGDRLRPPTKPAMVALYFKEIPPEIFIPPRIVS